MQSTTVRSLFKFTAANKVVLRDNYVRDRKRNHLYTSKKNDCRSLAVNSASINASEESQLKPWQEIPGPSSLLLIGQLHHFLPGGPLSDTSRFQENIYKLYGPIVRLDGLFGQAPILFVYDPESCATLLRGENWMPRRPGFESLQYYRKYHNKPKEQALKPTGLITDDGDNWKIVRSTVNPVMMQPKTIKLYAGVLEEVAQDMVTRMKSIRNENNMIDGNFDVEMNLWALEAIGVVALGGRLNCFDPDLPEDSPARKLIQCVHHIFKISNDLDFKPSLWRYYPTRKFKRAMKLYEEQESIAKYFVHKAMEELRKKKKKTDDEKGILEKLLEINEEIAIIMACDMLFAGVDTAANTMTSTLYYLAKNQEKQNKLREQIRSGDQRYLKACLKESLRIFPIVSGNLRQLTKDYSIMGYKIPKDMLVGFPHQSFSNWESQYPRPTEFIPERWLEKESPIYHGKAHPFAYSPFGFGVRSCIGRRIAELELETFLSKLIQNFQIEWSGPPPEVTMTSITYLKGPFHFIFKDI